MGWGGRAGRLGQQRRTSVPAHGLESTGGEEAPEKLSFLSTLKLALGLQTLLVTWPK